MPILVACPGCHARFQVSEKFAGAKGPCPKCKTVLTIPKPDDVKIHEPENFGAGGRDSKGRLVLKPIAREKRKITPLNVGIVAGVAITLLAAAWLLGPTVRDNPLLVGVGVVLVAPLLVVAGYEFLRDDEFEAYSGLQLWLRAGICSVAYAGCWGVFWFLPEVAIDEVWKWLFVAPLFVTFCALACMGCFDLDFGPATAHYAFFLVVTMLLRWAIGMPAIWEFAASGST